jgi:elongation factor 1-gamma
LLFSRIELIVVAKQDPNCALIPKDPASFAQMMQWMSFTNHEVLPSVGSWFRPIIGRDPYNKKNVDAAEVHIKKICKHLEDYLRDNTYLVGERITLADLVLTAGLDRGFCYVLIFLGLADDRCLMMSIALLSLIS